MSTLEREPLIVQYNFIVNDAKRRDFDKNQRSKGITNLFLRTPIHVLVITQKKAEFILIANFLHKASWSLTYDNAKECAISEQFAKGF